MPKRQSQNGKHIVRCVKIPKAMLNENEHRVVQYDEENDIAYVEVRRLVKKKEDYPSCSLEEWRRGYEEMSPLNLAISTECQHLEIEAHFIVERLGLGG